ncbi:MAG: response regulator [Chloroflexi bacterium]|nr:MAG: response regulator [Chloroflexota bacterium]
MPKETMPVMIQTDDVDKDKRESDDRREPVMPVRSTSTMTTVYLEKKESSRAETGTVAAVVSDKKENKDKQDAARSTAEVKVATKVKAKADKENKKDDPAKYSLLIIEDTTELAEILQASLEGLGLNITREAHGKKGLDRFYKMNPDVVLLDIALPDMTGWEFLEEVKQKRKESEKMPKIIVITAHGDPANRLIGKFQDVFQYLIKPFTPAEVEVVVKDALHEIENPKPKPVDSKQK